MTTAHALPLPELAQRTAAATQTLHGDIRARWSRFSDFDVGCLRDADDLASQVATKYGLDPAKARSDVDAVLKGRQI